MSEAAKALGFGPEIEFRGKRYRMVPWTLEMTALFEAWLEQRAFDAVAKTRNVVSEAEYQERLDAVIRLIAAGRFAFGSAAAAEAGRSLPGMKYCVYLQLKATDGDVTERLVEDMFAEKEAEVVAKLGAANASTDPPMPAPGPAPT
jgi:hypothetical protein